MAAAARPSASASVARGALALISTQPLTWGATLLTTILVPRLLGAERLGLYTVALTLANLTGMAATLGVPEYLKRHVATHGEGAEADAHAAVTLLTGAAALAALVLALLAPLGHFLVSDPAVLRVALAGMVVTTAQTAIFALVVGRERHAQFAWLNAAGVVLSTALGITVLAAGGSVAQYAIAVATGFGIVLAMSWRVAGMRLTTAAFDVRRWRRLASSGLPFLGWNFAIQVRNQIDVALVAALLGERGAGWLAGAYRIIAIPAFIPTLIATPLLPALSRCARTESRDAFRRVLRDSFTGVLVLTVPASALIAALAPSVPEVLGWGAEFQRSVPLMQILSITFPLMSVDVVLGTALFALHQERRWVRVGVAAAIFNPALNLLCIPLAERAYQQGVTAAALVEVSTELIMCAGAVVLLPRDLVNRNMAWLTVRTMVAGLCLVAVAVVLRPLSPYVAGAAGLFAYAVALLLLRVVRVEQVRRLLPGQRQGASRVAQVETVGQVGRVGQPGQPDVAPALAV